MVTEETVICWSRDGALARIGIHRPDKRNALATRHWAAIEAALDAIAASNTQIVVVSGVPGAFSAGADIDELGQLLTAPAAFAANAAKASTVFMLRAVMSMGSAPTRCASFDRPIPSGRCNHNTLPR